MCVEMLGGYVKCGVTVPEMNICAREGLGFRHVVQTLGLG